ncbi:MAG: hypothetical protein IPG79_15040 [Saprospiraceae bacterium]|nr:hypothetical protein [Saprospiraceae bacterium]
MQLRLPFIVQAIFITLVVFTSCSPKNRVPTFQDKDAVIRLQKGSCFGKCAVYTFTVYRNKYALYHGTMNTDKMGKHYKLLSDSVYSALTKQFKDSDFSKFDSIYQSDIVDFPTITIGYKENKIMKTVSYQNEKPQALSVLQLSLEKIANSFDWTAVKKQKSNIEYTPVGKNSSSDIYIKEEIIIEPAPGIEMARWLDRYVGYGVRVEKKMAPNFDYYLIKWDESTISPDDFLLLLKSDREIKSAEFNKKIMTREH